MWLVFTLLCTAAWGAADLFYKKGADPDDRYSHLRTSAIVGLVMGAHAIIIMLVKGIDYDPVNILIYLPVSLMYILSMTVGYFGLRYLELSISSPVQNTSGALVCIMCLIFLGDSLDILSAVGIVLITAGVFLLGLIEYRASRREAAGPADRKYRSSFVALMFPIAYCVIDALGTFFDAWYLDDPEATPLRGVTEETLEDTANISYELTFLFCSILIFVFIRLIKRERFFSGRRLTLDRSAAALFETGGQFAYVYAMSGNGAVAAPVVASYCMVSVVLSRIFLKEKLTLKQYGTVALAVAGIILLGIAEGLAE